MFDYRSAKNIESAIFDRAAVKYAVFFMHYRKVWLPSLRRLCNARRVFVCLSACLQLYVKTTKWIFTKILP